MSTSKTTKTLYPFLEGEKHKQPGASELLFSLNEKVEHSVSVKQRFFETHGEAIVNAAKAIAAVYQQGGRMFSMGNGGSSCDSAHFAVEFQHPVTPGRPALAATNLCNDMAVVTAVANDAGVEQVFARQLEAHARARDGLIGFSTSGNSSNMLAAFRCAKGLGLTTFGLAGGDGGEMLSSGLVDHCLTVQTDSIHRVQESHVACYHILWDLVHTLMANKRGKLGELK